jgi:hypothetical protein
MPLDGGENVRILVPAKVPDRLACRSAGHAPRDEFPAGKVVGLQPERSSVGDADETGLAVSD